MMQTDHSPIPSSLGDVDGVIDEAVTAGSQADAANGNRHVREHAGDGHRPLYHLWSDGERIIAPNALVRIGEEYHLFPQLDGGWGHAVSTDLVHWTDPAEGPRLAAGPGTVVVDRYDASGLFGGRSGLVALFTSPDPADDGIRMAHSTDRGAHWQVGDDVVLTSPADRKRFIDPMVVHDLDHHQWVMVVACGELLRFFRSDDLIHWAPSADHDRNYFGAGPWHEGGEFRHPELFPLRVQATNVTRWVLSWSSASSPTTNGSATRYAVGDWDGAVFTPLTDPSPVLRADSGRDFFAVTTCDDAPRGRRVMIARMSNEGYARQTPTDGWSGPLSTPREIGLVGTREGLRLTQYPVAEISGLHLSTRSVEDTPVGTEFNPIGNLGGRALDIEAELEVSSFYGAHAVTLQVRCGGDRHTDIVWRPAERTLTVDRSESGATEFSQSFATPSQTRDAPTESVVRADSAAVAVKWPESTLGGVRRVWMRILIDACSMEIFSADGLTAVTTAIFPGTGATGLRLSADAGAARLISMRASTMERVSQGRA